VVPGHVKLTFTLDMPREWAERLSARAIREGKKLDTLVIAILRDRTGEGARATEPPLSRLFARPVRARV